MSGEIGQTVDIRYRWIPVQSETGVPFTWGGALTAYMEHHYSKSCVYRWEIWEGSHLRAVYIGEAENLARRVRQYLRPRGKWSTDLRIHECLAKSALRGFDVRLETLDLEATLLNTIRIFNENLSDPLLRRFIEGLTIVDTDVTQCKLLNHVSNVFERRRSKAMKANPFLEALRKCGLVLD